LRIQVNGELLEVDDESSLSKLVSVLNLKPEQVAIELNQQVVRRAEWENTLLHEGDQVEIVHFVGGGHREEPLQNRAR
jgi:sulfur carrier protein